MNPAIARLLSRASFASLSTPLDASAVADGGVWLRLVPAGRFSARDGRGPFDAGDRAAMEEIVARTRAYHGSTDILIDYDHQSIFGARDGVGGTARAAGWIKEIEVRDDGIYGRVEWTAAAAASIRAQEYRYLSPYLPHHKQTGKIFLIINAAVTNTPALELEPLVASSLFSLSTNEGTDMEKILKALGLAEGTAEDAVLSAIAGHMAATTAIAAIATASGLKADARPEEVQTAVEAAFTARAAFASAVGLKAEATSDEIAAALKAGGSGGNPDPTKFVPIEAVAALRAEVKELKDGAAEKAAKDAVAAAMAAGKLPPAMEQWGLDLHKKDAAAFAAFVDGAPTLTAPQLRQAIRPGDGAAALSAEQEAVARMLGLDPKAYAETLKSEEKN